MNQSKQKAAALADAVRHYLDQTDRVERCFARPAVEAALADYEAIGPDEQSTAITEGDALADSLQKWMDDPQERDPDAFNVWVALKAYQKARAQHAPTEPALPAEDGAFKAFHKRLCERFGYVHDEQDWRRDLCSLEEHIAKSAKPATGEQSDFSALIKRLQRWHNDNVVDGIPLGDWHIEASPEQAAIILQNWLRERATGEQPGADWIDAIVAELWTDIYHTEEEVKAIIAKHCPHAPAKPALAEVSADSARLDWLQKAGKQSLSPLWAQDWIHIRSAIDAEIERERAVKAKEHHA